MSNWGSIHDNMMSGLREHARTLASLQEQVASGSRILRASDGPSQAHRIMSLQSQSQSLETYDGNIDRVITNLSQTATVLQELSDLLVHAKTLLIQAGNDTYSQAQRVTNGEAIDQLLAQAVWLANTEVLGQRLFSGDSTHTQPYVVEQTGGRTTAVTYQGSLASSSVPVAPGAEQPGMMVGSEVLANNDRQQPLLFGGTGAEAGTGTSTVRGDVWLTVIHDTTTYEGATGVQVGSRSAAEDTIVGTSHTLTIDADNNMVKLDSGGYVPYGLGGDDTNIMVTNGDGDVAYVDVTNLAGGLSGIVQVSITATAKLSIDDLDSTVDVTAFSANEAITDSVSGRILYVDASALARVGVEPVRVPGTYDMFGILIAARDTLRNERGLSRQQQTERVNGSIIDSLDEVIAGLIANATVVGGRLQAMGGLKQSMADIKAAVDVQRAELQDADIVQLATDLARAQAFYEMVLAVTGRVLRISLLDYL